MNDLSEVKHVGVLMLETRFPRLVGDIGNPETFEFPVTYRTVEGASPARVVKEQSLELLEPFINDARRLVEEGADLITTSCGFLYMFQSALSKAVDVPVIASSLLLLNELEGIYGKSKVGILTISRSSLSPQFRAHVGISDDVPIGSTEGGNEFSNAILENRSSFDVERCRQDNVSAAKELVKHNPDIRAVLLECTNMPPYSSAISEATDLPVYSINTLLRRRVQGIGLDDEPF